MLHNSYTYCIIAVTLNDKYMVMVKKQIKTNIIIITKHCTTVAAYLSFSIIYFSHKSHSFILYLKIQIHSSNICCRTQFKHNNQVKKHVSTFVYLQSIFCFEYQNRLYEEHRVQLTIPTPLIVSQHTYSKFTN